MQQPPPKPDPQDAPDGVARQRLSSDSPDWTEEQMRAARPREIRLNPDGTRAADTPLEDE